MILGFVLGLLTLPVLAAAYAIWWLLDISKERPPKHGTVLPFRRAR